jgi:hypothetical protein
MFTLDSKVEQGVVGGNGYGREEDVVPVSDAWNRRQILLGQDGSDPGPDLIEECLDFISEKSPGLGGRRTHLTTLQGLTSGPSHRGPIQANEDGG